MDARDGTKLWEFMTDAGVNAPPAVFEHNGKQYVAVLSAGNLLANADRGDSVWLFTLQDEGVESSVVVDQVTTPMPNFEGQRVFAEACQFCHGLRGEGGHNGMPLEGLAAFSTGYVADIITAGQNNMPSFATTYSAEQIRSVAEHVRTLNRSIPNRNSR